VGAVNAGSLASAMSGLNRPWLILARSLGLAASALGVASDIEVSPVGKLKRYGVELELRYEAF
jgi:hypothetical protein